MGGSRGDGGGVFARSNLVGEDGAERAGFARGFDSDGAQVVFKIGTPGEGDDFLHELLEELFTGYSGVFAQKGTQPGFAKHGPLMITRLEEAVGIGE